MHSETNREVHTRKGRGATHFRIFLASPGDVPLERKLAREAITHISSERRFRGRIDIEIVAWDQPGAAVAMEAGLTPQEAIAQGLPKPEDCDLAVIVLWSRIGTQLPADFELKEDGTPYLSGTEWEYVNALHGYKKHSKPAVWVYRRLGAPKLAADDSELAAKLDQWQKVEKFFQAFTNPDGSLAGGINHYESPDDFRQQFEHHLRDRLDKLLEALPAPTAAQTAESSTVAPCWTGSPYPGLASFSPEQAPIFFGRGAEIDQLLAQFSDPAVQFVAVVGLSGSGKSSLVKAGLLPRLRSGVAGYTPWTDLVFTPGQRGGDPFLSLAFALRAGLKTSDQTEKELARALRVEERHGIDLLTELLEQAAPAMELLLVVDQFEELFTLCNADDRRKFIDLLAIMVEQPHLRVIVTLRADFYARAIEEPVLASLLRRDRGTFPLDPPGPGALLEMITRPAEAAGVELEAGLPQRLLDDAGVGPGAMPLIAFTLNQLYRQATDASELTIAAYEAFGGVQGAVEKRAEEALKGLELDIDRVLHRLFTHLVEVNEQEIATRRRALKSELDDEAATVAEALIEARLLISGEGKDNQPTLEVAHETVLTGWTRLQQWIRDHAEALRIRRDLERVAREWDAAGRHGSALRGGKLLQRYLGAAQPLSEVAENYLTACKRHRRWQRTGTATLALLGITLLGLLFQINKSDYPPTLAAKALFVQMGIWPVTPPEMVQIPAGEFQMGDLSGEGDSDERPVHTVRFAQPFEMGKYEVTFKEYDLFAAATGRSKPSDEGWGRGTRPAINVSWEDATAYAKWLSARTGRQYHLPSEAEWEYAARAGTTTPRFWPEGDEGGRNPACTYANVFDAKNKSRIKATYTGITWDSFDCEDDFPFTAPVGSFKPNAWQLHDMLGNVWEWTRDCYRGSYEGAPIDGSPIVNDNCSRRVLRGGSWNYEPLYVRSANRNRDAPVYRNSALGFRLARTL